MKEITSALTALGTFGDEIDFIEQKRGVYNPGIVQANPREAVTDLGNTIWTRVPAGFKSSDGIHTSSGLPWDKISIEWNQDNRVCSVVCIYSKKK